MPNLVVIFGAPASGKAAIGQELSLLTGYRFFHNHMTADPAAALFGWGGKTFARTVEAMRTILFNEAAIEPTIPGVVFTFSWGLNLPDDTAFIDRTARLFASNGGQVYFVELLASLEARVAREGTPFRIDLKPAQRDVTAARARQHEMQGKYVMNTDGQLPLPYPHLILDTETMSPGQAAAKIATTFKLAASDA